MDEGQCQLGLVQCMMRRLQAYWRHDVHVLPRCRYRRYDGRDCIEYQYLRYGILLRYRRYGAAITPVRAADPGAECGPCPRETVLFRHQNVRRLWAASPRLR